MLCRLCRNTLRPSVPTKVANRAGVENDIQTVISTSEINRLNASVLDKRGLHANNNKCVCRSFGVRCGKPAARRRVRRKRLGEASVSSTDRASEHHVVMQRVGVRLVIATLLHLVRALEDCNVLTRSEELSTDATIVGLMRHRNRRIHRHTGVRI